VGFKRFSLLVVFAAVLSLGVVSGASAGNFDEERMGCVGDNPAVCPTGTTGTPYSLPIELGGDEDEGCAVFYVTSGSLPSGLSVTRSVVNETGYGLISGTPTEVGSFRFYLTAKLEREQSCVDNCGAKCSSDDEFIINVNPGLAKLTIGPESAAPGTTGTAYSLQMTATVEGQKTWSINSGALPSGLAIDASTGLISGTPMASGSYTFEVLAKMAADQRSDTKVLGIVVRQPLAILGSSPFSPARRAASEVSVPFTAILSATGGEGTYTWSLSTGALPPGLSLADGAIDGTPTLPGVYRFTATVTDAEGRVANYPGTIGVAAKLAISTLLLRPAKVGKLYGAKLATTGGLLPKKWKIKTGPLPRGIRFDRTLGVLSGTPTRPGRYRVTFEATDALKVTSTKTLVINVLL